MPKDVNQLAHRTVEIFTQEPEEQKVSRSLISRVMSEMGKKCGKISGRRMTNIPPERRRQIVLKAAQARWKKKQPPPEA